MKQKHLQYFENPTFKRSHQGSFIGRTTICRQLDAKFKQHNSESEIFKCPPEQLDSTSISSLSV